VWVERERGQEGWAAGANERGEVGEQGARLKSGAGARTWPENEWTWARPLWGDRGREVEDELTGGDNETERESGCGGGGGGGAGPPTPGPRPGPRGSERERGRAGKTG
jgi:hypothetical protein